MKTQKGFTLLEAIVAITIFSAASVALYSWYGTVMIGLIRAQEHIESVEFYENLDSHLETLNLTEESTGQYSADGYTALWRASLLEPKKDGVNIGGAQGYYQIGLYHLEIELFREEVDEPIDRITTRLVGYEGVRVPRVGPGER